MGSILIELKNIIFVEGVSGVGKSTTVQSLSNRLNDLGYRTKCYLEGGESSPLDLCWTANTKLSNIDTFTDLFVNLWRKFVDDYENECDYMIFDATLVSHMTNDLIRNYNASTSEIINHLEMLISIINHLNPIILYLSSDNVCERLIAARQSRSEIPPDIEKIKFWERRKSIDLFVLPKLSIQSNIIDITHGWDNATDNAISIIKNKPYQ